MWTNNPIILFIFTLANLAITGGYLFIAFAIVPRIKVTLTRTKIGGVGFFVLCGLTHIDMALHALFSDRETYGEIASSWHMLAIHVPQAVCVWLFVTGLYIELVTWGPWATERPTDKKTAPVTELVDESDVDD